MLTPEQQRLFRCLSVFRGGFTLDAVQALWSDGEKGDQDALELLTHLVDKSLVAITSRTETRRFGLLETIRQYAWERLESAGETEATLARHRQWFTSWVKKQGRLLSTPDQLVALEALEADYDNLRAVLERSMASGDVEPALRIAADISLFLVAPLAFWRSRRMVQTPPGGRRKGAALCAGQAAPRGRPVLLEHVRS